MYSGMSFKGSVIHAHGISGVPPRKKTKKERRWKHVKISDQQLAMTEDDLNENPAVPQQGADGLSRLSAERYSWRVVKAVI